jgi:hypothetical protein
MAGDGRPTLWSEDVSAIVAPASACGGPAVLGLLGGVKGGRRTVLVVRVGGEMVFVCVWGRERSACLPYFAFPFFLRPSSSSSWSSLTIKDHPLLAPPSTPTNK